MKKLMIIVLAMAVVIGISGVSAASFYEEGTYMGYSNAGPRGYVEAVVSVEDGEITEVELTEYTDFDEAKGEGYPHDEWHEAMEELPSRFVESNQAQVDIVSGATSTSNKAMEAVNQALMRAMGATSFNGTYMGSSDLNDRGGYGVAWVTVENGEIVDVDLEEVDGDGEFKDEDYQYDPWHDAVDEFAERIEEANSYEVDIYSGATSSSNMWMQAVERALEKAGH